MRKSAIILFSSISVACTSIQTQTTGKAVVSGNNYDEVFSSAVQSAMNAGLTVTKAEKENGFILAVASNNPFLTNNAPVINIFVHKVNDAININLKSTVHGQLIDYGTSENNISSFCSSFTQIYPKSTCQLIKQ
jgi:hypothetical protein